MTYLLSHLFMDVQKVVAGETLFYVARKFTQESRPNDGRLMEVEHYLNDFFGNEKLS